MGPVPQMASVFNVESHCPDGLYYLTSFTIGALELRGNSAPVGSFKTKTGLGRIAVGLNTKRIFPLADISELEIVNDSN